MPSSKLKVVGNTTRGKGNQNMALLSYDNGALQPIRNPLDACQRQKKSKSSENPSAPATCHGLTTAYAIGAASGTGQEVFNSLDSNISPEHLLENGLF